MMNTQFREKSNVTLATDAEIAEARIRKRVRGLAEFYRHLVVYIMVIGFLWVLAWLTGGIRFDGPVWMMWPIFPTLGWGFGLFCHALSVFTGIFSFNAEWQERKVKEYLAQEQARRNEVGK
jgi:two-component system, LytTR family, sensor kinase